MEISTYGPVEDGANYEIFVGRLFDIGHYRVTLCKEGSPKTTECFDVDLKRPNHRRALEEYIAKMKEHVNVVGIWFRNTGSSTSYALETYRERNKNFPSMEFINELNF